MVAKFFVIRDSETIIKSHGVTFDQEDNLCTPLEFGLQCVPKLENSAREPPPPPLTYETLSPYSVNVLH